MPADVAGSNRFALRHQGAEHPVNARQAPDAVGARFGDANREETTKASVAIGDAERAESGADQARRRPENLFQHPIEIEVAGNRQRGLIERCQPPSAFRHVPFWCGFPTPGRHLRPRERCFLDRRSRDGAVDDLESRRVTQHFHIVALEAKLYRTLARAEILQREIGQPVG